MLLVFTNQSTPSVPVVTPYTMNVYQSTRKSISGVNFSDNKIIADVTHEYYIANNDHVGLMTLSATDGILTIQNQFKGIGLSVDNITLQMKAGKLQIWGSFPGFLYNNANGMLVVTTNVDASILAFRLS
jgi:hypothetical protein